MVQTQQNMTSKRDQVMRLVASNPKFTQAIQEIMARLSQTAVTPEIIAEIIKGLEFVLDHPDQYEQLRDQAIQSGMMTDRDSPPQYNRVFVITMMAALYAVQENMPQSGVQEFSNGGLARSAERLQSMGRGGDTMLAHINPKEAEILRRMGGGGTINPNTGLIEFKSGIGKVLGVIAAVAMPWIAPMVGGAIAGATGLTLGTMGTAALGGAAVGGVSSALQGGDFLKGALTGGITGGISGGLGNTIGSSLLPAGTSSALSGAVGSGLAGGFAGAATGQGFKQGALSGLMTHGMSQLGPKPSDAAVSSFAKSGPQSPLGTDLAAPVAGINSPITQALNTPTGLEMASQGALGGSGGAPTKAASDLFSASNLMKMAPLAASALSMATTPEQVRAGLSPDQQAYFDRTINVWDWDKIKADATTAGKPLGSFVAENWDKVNSGGYNKPSASPLAPPTAAESLAPVAREPVREFARGGALSRVAYLAKGSGTGRSDEIPARLSAGEFVIDAETVGLLGDGSTEAGARKLDEMRSAIRKHKGKQLAKGKFSPNAKSPLNYIKEAA